MDMTESIAPKTDQQNFDDYLIGPRTVTITAVKQGSPEQPVSVELAEYPGRPFKPNKSMRRVMVSAWGAETDAYVGRRLTLFGNPKVVYGGKPVGGIEISHMSNLPKRLTLALTETRGKKRSFSVDPLPDATPAAPTIPADVVAQTAKAIAEGAADKYLAWLTEQGAPDHITDYVKEQSK